MRHTFRRVVFTMFLLSVVFSLGLGSNAAASEVLKFGMSIPLSGPAAPWGVGLDRALKMVCEKNNKAGGIKVGGKTYTLKAISYDCKGLPSEAAAQATKLVYKDKVKYILGGVIAATGEAILPVTTPEKVITTSCWWGKNILSPKRPYSFRQTVSQYEIVPAFYEWITKKRPDLKTLAIVSPNDTSGWDTAAAIREEAKKYGIKIVADEFYERSTKDMSPFLTRIIAQKPDFIDLGGAPPGNGAIILKQLHALGYKGQKVWSCGTDPKLILKLVGPACKGVWFSYGHDMEGPNGTDTTRRICKEYREKYSDDFSIPSMTEYAIAEVILQAMKEANSLNTDDVVKAIEKKKMFDTSYGPFYLTGKKEYGIDRQFIHQMMVCETTGTELKEIAWLKMPGLKKPKFNK